MRAASVLSHAPRVVAAYLRQGEDGLAELADRLREQAHERPGGKFSKRRALYLPQSPFPPLFWRNQCERCRFWYEGAPGEPGGCTIVGLQDDPFGGEAIHPRGWCALWMPPAGEPAFAWLRERLHPDGASAVRGQYRERLASRQGGDGPAGREGATRREVTVPIEEDEADD